MQSPTDTYIQYVKCLLQYPGHTTSLGLTFTIGTTTHSLQLIGYSDADWGGGDPTTLQSTFGSSFLLVGAALSWQSKKEDRVFLSSTEAEYMSMTLALKEGIWLKEFIEESKLYKPQPLLLHCNNLSAILLARNLKHSEKTKHIAIKVQFIRELVRDGSIVLTHVRTDQ
ncbi:hypothetical protein KP509_1Z127500 [Ceratopteris richardii]|nr:hypothetical protein KP509_1Z149100 [Ceratopteris richardii]KAH6557216.1 hypothetical protein KP509_1Z127500 [Ceratopteris richardii]